MSKKKQRKAATPEEQAVLDKFNQQWESYVPDGICEIAPSQMRKFTWEPGDLVEVRPTRRKRKQKPA